MTTLDPRDLRSPITALTPAAVRSRLARTILAQVIDRVPVDVLLPDGSRLGRRSGPGQAPAARVRTTEPSGIRPKASRPTLELVRPAAFFERLARHPKIGIGEGYMAGDWRAAPGTDLADVLRPFAERVATAIPKPWLALRQLVDRRVPREQRNSITGSRRNIEAHYDLSNDLFAAFLDETLTYSSALFDPSRPRAEQDLAEAQLRKIHTILDAAGVTEGSRVLEIGTGWGTLAIEAARRGAHVTTLTLSHEQADLARERVAAAGFADRVDIRLEDYRQAVGQFDAVVSVEMIEAVGEEYWPTYFATIDARLAPGGRAAVQAILMSHERYLVTRSSYGWIQKHIFPGGLIPSLDAIREATSGHTSLRVSGAQSFGVDYAETLRRWRATFLAQWPRIEQLGFDETFRRKWEFYLAYCEAGFDSGYLDVAQIRFER